MASKNKMNKTYRKVAEKSRKIDKMNLRWAEIGPNIHVIKRFKLIPPYAYNESWFIRPLVIKRYNTGRDKI